MKELDLALLRAWPPAEERRVGRWLVRLDGGVTRRANSVLPLGRGPDPTDAELDGWLDRCRSLYEARGLTPYVQVTDAAWPAGLGDALAARGWTTGIDPSVVLAGAPRFESVGVEAGVEAGVEGSHWTVTRGAQPTGAWLDAWWEVDARGDATALPTLVALLQRIDLPHVYLRVDDGETIGTCLAVRVGRSTVIDCLATRARWRRRGVARALLAEAWRWGLERGSIRMVLAVVATNAAARALHGGIGLAELSGYAYARP